ncbi:MAG: hypothetical protein GC162_06950 [Planctomycetes bacterium]|nr:hypothetical protein [Planctomycetota bacterium]
MARRRQVAEPPVTLFPFLSILACVIGVLTLMITAMVLGEIDPGHVAQTALFMRQQEDRDDHFKQVSNQSDRDREEIQRLQKLLEEAENVRQQVAAARSELARLEAERTQQIRNLVANKGNNAQMLAEANDLRLRVVELEPELRDLQEKIESLKREIADRKKKPEESQVTILPSGSGTDLKPRFVECNAGGVVLYEGADTVHVRRGDLAKSEPFLKLLDAVASGKDETVIFLIREDGLGTYFVARGIARSRYARNGKLPVYGQGKIDLTMFKDLIKK